MFDLIKKYKLVLSLIALFFALLITLINSRHLRESPLYSIVQMITYPVQTLVQATTDFASNMIHSYVYLVDLKEENEKLHEQVKSLQEEVNQYIEESVQFHRLKIQLEFAEQNPQRKIFAEVIGESVDHLHQTLQINRGSWHQIERNFAVILKEGVVGRIQAVGPFQSIVQVVMDYRSRFPAIIQRTRSKGMVYGTGKGLELRRISRRSDIQVGDRVMTSGLNDLFPKGLLVGVVTEVREESHELFQTAVITPEVDFYKIEGVFVILKDQNLHDFDDVSSK